MFRWLYKTLERRYTKEQLGHPSQLKYWIGKLFYGGGMDTPSHGINVTEKSALTFSAYWRAINILSDIIACLPLKVYKRTDGGKEEDSGNNINILLNYRPNPMMDARAFRKTIQSHAVGYGNGYAEIERNGRGEPIALWPLLPDRTTPRLIKIGEKKQLIFEVRDGGNIARIPPEDVLHIMGLSFDGLKGVPLISYAAWSLGVGIAAERYSADFFGNDATPVGGVKVPEALGKNEVDALRESWEGQHKGIGKKHTVSILHSGMEFQPISIPAKDAELIATRKISIAEVSRWTGIPPHMLGEMEFSKYNNIEHLGIEFRTYGLLTWLRAWELQCMLKLFGDFKTHLVEFLADAILRTDIKSRYTAYRVGRQWGWLSADDIRRKENMNPLPDGKGDIYLVPLNMVEAGTQPPVSGGAVADDAGRAMDNRWCHSVELLEKTWERILTKETKAAAAAARKGARAVEDCYEKLSSHIDSVLWPVARSIFGERAERHLAEMVTEYLKEHRGAILGALDDGGDCKERIAELTREWMNDCPVRMARLTVKGQYDGED
jgi:HK97 family phage portal protein